MVMLSVFWYIILSVLVVSIIPLVVILFFLSSDNKKRDGLVYFLVSLAAGALFGDALIHLIPEALKESPNVTLTSFYIALGILLFFVLEKFLHWRHDHEPHRHSIDRDKGAVLPLGHMSLISDGFHNFLDGMVMAAGYLVSVEVGLATTVAVILHEIPQEIGDIGILIHSGFSRGRAVWLNFLTACAAFLGAVLVFWGAVNLEALVPIVLPLAAGGFLYIAGSDLVPELHKISGVKWAVLQFIGIALGLALMFAILFFE